MVRRSATPPTPINDQNCKGPAGEAPWRDVAIADRGQSLHGRIQAVGQRPPRLSEAQASKDD